MITLYNLDDIDFIEINEFSIEISQKLRKEVKQLTSRVNEFYESEDYERAIVMLKNAIEYDEQWYFYYNIGALYYLLKKPKEAIQYLEAALKIGDSFDIFIKFHLAKINFSIREYDKSLRYFISVEKYQKYKLSEVYYWLSQIKKKMGDGNRAISYLRKATELKERKEVAIELKPNEEKYTPIIMKKEAWDSLRRDFLQNLSDRSKRNKWNYPITLSCNSSREVWFSIKNGYHWPKEREQILLNDYPALEFILDRFLNIRSIGGRFHITKDEVICAKYKNLICKIKIE